MTRQSSGGESLIRRHVICLRRKQTLSKRQITVTGAKQLKRKRRLEDEKRTCSAASAVLTELVHCSLDIRVSSLRGELMKRTERGEFMQTPPSVAWIYSYRLDQPLTPFQACVCFFFLPRHLKPSWIFRSRCLPSGRRMEREDEGKQE